MRLQNLCQILEWFVGWFLRHNEAAKQLERRRSHYWQECRPFLARISSPPWKTAAVPCIADSSCPMCRLRCSLQLSPWLDWSNSVHLRRQLCGVCKVWVSIADKQPNEPTINNSMTTRQSQPTHGPWVQGTHWLTNQLTEKYTWSLKIYNHARQANVTVTVTLPCQPYN